MTSTTAVSSKLSLPLPYREIVVCTDGSSEMEPILATGRALADTFGAELRLVHAVASAEADAAEMLDNAEGQAAAQQALLDTVPAVEGVLWNVTEPILSYLAARPHALPVLAAHARKRVGRTLLGSVSAAVIRELHRPVVILGPAADGAPARISRVVACTDASEFALEAVRVAGGLARDLLSELWLVEVLEPGLRAATNLQATANQLSGLGVTANWETLHDRHPQRAIVDFAGLDATTLTVMATHGRTGWRDLLMGSTTTEVIRQARGPVVVVRPLEPSR